MIARKERSLRLRDGVETLVEIWGEHGPIVLAVHGMTSSRRSWERLAHHLSGRYRLVAYDQRGHGDSSHLEGPMTLEQACQDLEDVAASLGEPINTMIGHSWGGAVVIIEGVKLRPQRVVAIDPMIRQVSTSWYDEFLEELHALFSLTGDERIARVREAFAHWHEIDRDGKIHAVATMTTRPIERLRDENPASGWDLRNILASYPIPLLLIMADPGESIVSQPDLADVWTRGGSRVRIVTLDGQGHNLHRTGFDQFADKLDAMMEDGGHGWD